MMIFQTMPFWDIMQIPRKRIKDRFKYFFGEGYKKIEDRQEALEVLSNVTSTIQEETISRLKLESSYGILLKLYFIFNEVHSIYLMEKELRTALVKKNIDNEAAIDALISNRNIERDIIDACNIWIENCVLYQHDLDIKNLNIKEEFIMDYSLIIDMYLYGFSSRAISLLMLSKKVGKDNTFYGLEIITEKDIPAEVLKYHPYVYFNTAIMGNQNVLVDIPLTPNANDTEFGKGFFAENKVQFLLFLAAIINFHKYQLRDDNKSLTVISKEEFISSVENYTNPKIEDGEAFYESFVLTRDKIKQHLRKNEEIIWVIGANKYRHEIRPFIGLDDGNVLIAYGALEQAKHLWISYFSNGDMCYTNPKNPDSLTVAMKKETKNCRIF